LATQAYAKDERELEFSVTVQAEDSSMRFSTREPVAARGGRPQRYPYKIEIPLQEFPSGHYLMTVRVTSIANPTRSVMRDVPFAVS